MEFIGCICGERGVEEVNNNQRSKSKGENLLNSSKNLSGLLAFSIFTNFFFKYPFNFCFVDS